MLAARGADGAITPGVTPAPAGQALQPAQKTHPAPKQCALATTMQQLQVGRQAGRLRPQAKPFAAPCPATQQLHAPAMGQLHFRPNEKSSRSSTIARGFAVGIDLGTTSSAVAILDRDGKPYVLEDEQGKVETPSVVTFTKVRWCRSMRACTALCTQRMPACRTRTACKSTSVIPVSYISVSKGCLNVLQPSTTRRTQQAARLAALHHTQPGIQSTQTHSWLGWPLRCRGGGCWWGGRLRRQQLMGRAVQPPTSILRSGSWGAGQSPSALHPRLLLCPHT